MLAVSATVVGGTAVVLAVGDKVRLSVDETVVGDRTVSPKASRW